MPVTTELTVSGYVECLSRRSSRVSGYDECLSRRSSRPCPLLWCPDFKDKMFYLFPLSILVYFLPVLVDVACSISNSVFGGQRLLIYFTILRIVWCPSLTCIVHNNR